jgi:hypothetical protein
MVGSDALVVALYDFGDRAGRNDALAAAFTTYRRALAAAWHAQLRLN